MRTTISNKIYVFDTTLELYWWCKDNLIIKNPLYDQMMRLGKEDIISRSHIPEEMKLYVEKGSDLILPFGCLYAIWPMIKDYPYELRFNNCDIVMSQSEKPTDKLFDYQEEAVQRMLVAKGGVLEAAAGSGKTNIGIEIAKRLGKNTLWLCHTADLLRQTVQRIHHLYPNISVGTITDGDIHMVSNGITVATIQTMVSVDEDIYKNEFDTVICDECHHVSGTPTLRKMFAKVIEKIPARYKYGLSATLVRADTMINSMYALIGCNLDGEFKPVWTIAKEKTNTLIAKHIRVDLDTPWTYSVLCDDGSFDYMSLIDYLSTNKERNEKIVENIIKTLETHKKQIVLCQRIEQCETINNLLVEHGVNSVLLVGKVTKKKRQEILNRNVNWNVIVATYSLAKEGLDVKELSCLHWAMLTCDKVSTVQSAGRIERVCEGKPYPEIYDYVDVEFPYCVGKYKKRAGYLRRR